MKKPLNLRSLFFATVAATIASFPQSSRGADKLIPSEPIIAARDCILEIIAPQMLVTLDPARALPVIRPETTTTLQDFQNSIEGFWNFRPDVFTNVFNPLRNEVFIMTERAYYDKHSRSVFDSLAHELVHYLQKEYKGADFTVGDDSLEAQAVDVQTWFRETYRSQFQGDEFVCPAPAI